MYSIGTLAGKGMLTDIMVLTNKNMFKRGSRIMQDPKTDGGRL